MRISAIEKREQKLFCPLVYTAIRLPFLENTRLAIRPDRKRKLAYKSRGVVGAEQGCRSNVTWRLNRADLCKPISRVARLTLACCFYELVGDVLLR
jgi:hypothetical protein